MMELLKNVEKLKDRDLISKDDIIKLRGSIQRNRLSAKLIIELIIKLSDAIENLQNIKESESKTKKNKE